MAAIQKIKDGTTTLDMLLPTTGFDLVHTGYKFRSPGMKNIRRQSQLTEGEAIVHSEAANIVETYVCILEASSNNAVATVLQTLATLRRRCREYHTTNWQSSPVYLEQKTVNETGTRYALIYSIEFQDGLLFNTEFENNNTIKDITVVVEREPYWRSGAPGVLPSALTISAPQSPSPQVVGTEQVIANFRDTIALTHVYNYDDDLTAFSSNLIAATAFNYFEVASSTPADDDAVYFGSTQGAFHHVILYIATIGAFTATVVWEYWDGAAWTASGIDKHLVFSTSAGADGLQRITITAPSNWAATTINTVSAHWVRARLDTVSAWTTSPAQGAQVVYNSRSPYISISNTAITGDERALILLRWRGGTDSTPTPRPSILIAGLRSRNLTNFTSRINAGDAGNPAFVGSALYGDDTSAVADVNAPGGFNATVTFATNQAFAMRVLFGPGVANGADMVGVFHLFLRCQQTGGSAGDVSVGIVAGTSDGNQISAETPLQLVGAGAELVSLGQYSFGTPATSSGESTSGLVTLQIYAGALSATPDLKIYDVVFIPVDEAAFALYPSQNGSQLIGSASGLEIDAGIIRQDSTYRILSGLSTDYIAGRSELRGELMTIQPDTACQIHFLIAGWDNVGNLVSLEDYAGTVKLFAHSRWATLRGTE